MTPTPDLFRFRRFPPDVILWAVRWYLRYALTYRDLETMMTERGVAMDYTIIYRKIQLLQLRLQYGLVLLSHR